jgi:hypothetical protein
MEGILRFFKAKSLINNGQFYELIGNAAFLLFLALFSLIAIKYKVNDAIPSVMNADEKQQ